MASMKRGAVVAFTLMLIAVIVSACNQPYSQQPSVTNTPIDQSLFATPLGQTPGMNTVETFLTGTALALQTATPIVNTTPIDATSQSIGVTETPTPLITMNTATATLAVGSGVTTTPLPPLAAGEYILRKEEFPFCIARRSGVNPYDLLRASNLTSPDIYYEGLKVRIPQNSVWNEVDLGPRRLRTDHSYAVTGNGDTTVYGVACKYGAVDPAAIAQANGISVDARLTVGQTLTIP